MLYFLNAAAGICLFINSCLKYLNLLLICIAYKKNIIIFAAETIIEKL